MGTTQSFMQDEMEKLKQEAEAGSVGIGSDNRPNKDQIAAFINSSSHATKLVDAGPNSDRDCELFKMLTEKQKMEKVENEALSIEITSEGNTAGDSKNVSATDRQVSMDSDLEERPLVIVEGGITENNVKQDKAVVAENMSHLGPKKKFLKCLQRSQSDSGMGSAGNSDSRPQSRSGSFSQSTNNSATASPALTGPDSKDSVQKVGPSGDSGQVTPTEVEEGQGNGKQEGINLRERFNDLMEQSIRNQLRLCASPVDDQVSVISGKKSDISAIKTEPPVGVRLPVNTDASSCSSVKPVPVHLHHPASSDLKRDGGNEVCSTASSASRSEPPPLIKTAEIREVQNRMTHPVPQSPDPMLLHTRTFQQHSPQGPRQQTSPHAMGADMSRYFPTTTSKNPSSASHCPGPVLDNRPVISRIAGAIRESRIVRDSRLSLESRQPFDSRSSLDHRDSRSSSMDSRTSWDSRNSLDNRHNAPNVMDSRNARNAGPHLMDSRSTVDSQSVAPFIDSRSSDHMVKSEKTVHAPYGSYSGHSHSNNNTHPNLPSPRMWPSPGHALYPVMKDPRETQGHSITHGRPIVYSHPSTVPDSVKHDTRISLHHQHPPASPRSASPGSSTHSTGMHHHPASNSMFRHPMSSKDMEHSMNQTAPITSGDYRLSVSQRPGLSSSVPGIRQKHVAGASNWGPTTQPGQTTVSASIVWPPRAPAALVPRVQSQPQGRTRQEDIMQPTAVAYRPTNPPTHHTVPPQRSALPMPPLMGPGPSKHDMTRMPAPGHHYATMPQLSPTGAASRVHHAQEASQHMVSSSTKPAMYSSIPNQLPSHRTSPGYGGSSSSRSREQSPHHQSSGSYPPHHYSKQHPNPSPNQYPPQPQGTVHATNPHRVTPDIGRPETLYPGQSPGTALQRNQAIQQARPASRNAPQTSPHSGSTTPVPQRSELPLDLSTKRKSVSGTPEPARPAKAAKPNSGDSPLDLTVKKEETVRPYVWRPSNPTAVASAVVGPMVAQISRPPSRPSSRPPERPQTPQQQQPPGVSTHIKSLEDSMTKHIQTMQQARPTYIPPSYMGMHHGMPYMARPIGPVDGSAPPRPGPPMFARPPEPLAQAPQGTCSKMPPPSGVTAQHYSPTVEPKIQQSQPYAKPTAPFPSTQPSKPAMIGRAEPYIVRPSVAPMRPNPPRHISATSMPVTETATAAISNSAPATSRPPSSSGGNRTSITASILGNHPIDDILYLKCNVCNSPTSTYGSLHSFRKHFNKIHGFDPQKEHVTIRSISEAKDRGTRTMPTLPNSPIIPPVESPVMSAVGVPHSVNHRDPDTKDSSSDHLTPSPKPSRDIPESFSPKKPSSPSESSEDSSISDDKMKESVDHSGQSTMRCLQCGQDFPTRDWGVFKRHVRAHDFPPLRCNICRQTFQDAEELKTHNTTYHQAQSCVCRVCDVGFSHPGALSKHMRTSHHGQAGADAEYRCMYCPEVFKQQQHWYSHLANHEQGICIPRVSPMTTNTAMGIVHRATPDSTNEMVDRKPQVFIVPDEDSNNSRASQPRDSSSSEQSQKESKDNKDGRTPGDSETMTLGRTIFQIITEKVEQESRRQFAELEKARAEAQRLKSTEAQIQTEGEPSISSNKDKVEVLDQSTRVATPPVFHEKKTDAAKVGVPILPIPSSPPHPVHPKRKGYNPAEWAPKASSSNQQTTQPSRSKISSKGLISAGEALDLFLKQAFLSQDLEDNKEAPKLILNQLKDSEKSEHDASQKDMPPSHTPSLSSASASQVVKSMPSMEISNDPVAAVGKTCTEDHKARSCDDQPNPVARPNDDSKDVYEKAEQQSVQEQQVKLFLEEKIPLAEGESEPDGCDNTKDATIGEGGNEENKDETIDKQSSRSPAPSRKSTRPHIPPERFRFAQYDCTRGLKKDDFIRFSGESDTDGNEKELKHCSSEEKAVREHYPDSSTPSPDKQEGKIEASMSEELPEQKQNEQEEKQDETETKGDIKFESNFGDDESTCDAIDMTDQSNIQKEMEESDETETKRKDNLVTSFSQQGLNKMFGSKEHRDTPDGNKAKEEGSLESVEEPLFETTSDDTSIEVRKSVNSVLEKIENEISSNEERKEDVNEAVNEKNPNIVPKINQISESSSNHSSMDESSMDSQNYVRKKQTARKSMVSVNNERQLLLLKRPLVEEPSSDEDQTAKRVRDCKVKLMDISHSPKYSDYMDSGKSRFSDLMDVLDEGKEKEERGGQEGKGCTGYSSAPEHTRRTRGRPRRNLPGGATPPRQLSPASAVDREMH